MNINEHQNLRYRTVLEIHRLEVLHAIKELLDKHAIDYQVVDECELNNEQSQGWSNGYARLQLENKSFERGYQLLVTHQFVEPLENNEPFLFVQEVNDFASRLPFFKNIRAELRFLYFIGTLVILIGVILFFIKKR